MGSEQRRSLRRPVSAEFRARDSSGTGDLHFEAADLSAGGTFLRSELLLEEGEPLSLEFTLGTAARPLRVQARVAWVRRFPRDGEHAGMGIEFLAMSDDDRGALEAYVAREG